MNVLLIAIDTLRADHLGCYGYKRPTSPAIDALAASGVRADRFLAPGIPTHPSFTTLFSGQHPIRHGVVAHGGRNVLADRTPTIPQLFNEKGFTTASFDNLPRHRSYFGKGFEIQVDASVRRKCDLLVSCEEINARVLPFLKQMGESREPFFAFLHYWDPHTPYWAPPRYRSLFYEGDPFDPKQSSLAPLYEHPLGKQWGGTWFQTIARAWDRVPDAKITDAAYVSALYDQEIRHVDDGVADVLAALDANKLAGDTLVLLVGDHGECLAEHAIFFDHHGLYDENLHVPFIARWPGHIPAGRELGSLVQHLDVMPTLCEAAGLRIPEEIDGKSAWGLLTGAREGEVLAERIVSEECTWQMKWSLRDPAWHFILSRERDAYGNPMRELYDLKADPGLTRNLAETKADVARELEGELEGWIAERLKACGRIQDPLIEHGITLGKRNEKGEAA